MAKKYEFQPDKPYATWLSKLHLTRQQQKQLLKWALYALSLVVLSVVQDVVLCRLRIYGGTTDLVPCFIFLICVLEGTQRGCVFALAASLFYLRSGSAPGPHVLVLITVLSAAATALYQAYLRPGFPAIVLCITLCMAFYELGIFAFCLLLEQVTFDRYMSFAVPAVLSLAALPVLYPIMRSVSSIGGETWKE